MARAWVTATDAGSVTNSQAVSGRASAKGQRTLWFRVGDATPGAPVIIEVRIRRHGRKGACQASFRPRSGPALAAAPAQPSASPSSPQAPAPPPATATSCYPLSNEGTCYEPGEYCRDDDHGMTGVAGDGERIVCEDNDGWRWEPA